MRLVLCNAEPHDQGYVALEELLARLQTIDERERISLAEVIRQGLEPCAAHLSGPLGSSAPDDTDYEPASWR